MTPSSEPATFGPICRSVEHLKVLLAFFMAALRGVSLQYFSRRRL
jgi:hypothetical protein